MFALIYTSDAVQDCDKSMLMNILNTSIKHNAQNEVTGVLLYREQKFMQLLEGEEKTVMDLYQRIAEDKRHTNCQILHSFNIAKRNVDQWSMGFLHVEADSQFNYQYVDFIMQLANQKFQDESAILHTELLNFARQ